MTSILDQLYYGQFDLCAMPVSDEYKKCAKKLSPYWDQMGEQLGMSFCTDFSNALAEQESIREREMFREGFRLGSRLMLELMGDKDSASL